MKFKIHTKRVKQKIAAIIISLIMIIGCGDKPNSTNNNQEKFMPSVQSVQAKYGSLPLTERLTGVVKAKNQVELFPQINAVITEIYVMNGDVVKKGDPLIKLRDIEYQKQLKQAEANYLIASAQKKQADAELNKILLELKRTEVMAEKDLISDSELEDVKTRAITAEADLDLAKARVDQALATIDERKENLSRTIIRAPVSGSIGNRNAEIGMRVNPNTRLFTLGELNSLKIEVVLTDLMLNYISVGQRSEILAANIPSNKIDASLSRISPFLNPVTHSTNAEIDISNPDGRLKPGMFVTVDIFYGESEQATIVPLSALYDDPATGVTGVYVTTDSLMLKLKPGAISDNPVELSDPVNFNFVPVEIVAKGRMQAGIRGLEPEDWIIVLGQNLLGGKSDSARVNVLDWDRVEELQNMQSEDLLKKVMNED